MNRRINAALLALALPLGLMACGSDDPDTASSSGSPEATAGDAAFPVTVAGVTIEAVPERIVSLSPTATESLFAIGAGDQVVAADEYSTYPEEAPDTDLSGFKPNVEAIADHEPDLVIMARDADDTVAALGDLDIPVLVLPAAVVLDDVYTQINLLGVATGHAEPAAELADEVEAGIDDVVDEVGDAGAGLTYYYELGTEYYSATSKTFIGQVLALLGLENIADAAGSETSDYPQLSAEFIIDEDPDLILLADSIGAEQSAESVAAREGWGGMKAVTEGGVVSIDDDVASRWGPRLPSLLAAVADGIEKVAL